MKLNKLIFFIGILIFLYPTLSDYWNSFHQSQVISHYEERVENLKQEDYEGYLSRARDYNETLGEQGLHWNLTETEKREYDSVLNMYQDGMMGYIEIPVINCRLPIYHGTEESVLQVGAGHMEGSSLPVGGENSHCVISGHRGLTSARLFTGLDKLKEGDIFVLSVLNEKMYYQVDQIQTVLPEETQTLKIEDGMDLCTLVTCTPYGVNTHRLLVRGSRISDVQAQGNENSRTEGGMQMRIEQLGKWVAVCLLVILFWGSSKTQVRAETQSDMYEIEIHYEFNGVEFMLYRVENPEDEFETEHTMPMQTQKTNSAGKAVFSKVQAGKYIVVGKTYTKDNTVYTPVKVELTVPANTENASRKIIVNPKYEKEPQEEQQEQPTEEPEESTENPEKTPEPIPDGMLPQTGQLWWPVTVLVMSGIILVVIGRKREEKTTGLT